MTPKEKLLAQKLLKIAQNQQAVLEKLAQQVQNSSVEYLRNVAQVAGVNANPPVSLNATVMPKDGGGYTITLDGFPPVKQNDPKDVQRDNSLKMSVKKNFDNQLQAQGRGDLLNSIALIYNNKPVGTA